MNIWKYLKDLLDGKTSGGTVDNSEITEKIKEITESEAAPARPKLDDPASYERMTYDELTDDEIRERAESSLDEYKRSGLSSIEDEYAALGEKYASDRETGRAAYERTLGELDKAYESAVESANADALRRGLARSSIAAGTVAALYGEKAGRAADAAASYEQADAELAEKISGLEAKRRKAIDDFNVAYTARLTQQINELTDEREQLRREALKYNNSLTEKENAEALERRKAESDLYSEALSQEKARRELVENPTDAQKKQQQQRIYDLFRERLLTMSAADAYNEMNKDPIYRKYLDPEYFYRLYDEFGR